MCILQAFAATAAFAERGEHQLKGIDGSWRLVLRKFGVVRWRGG
jgi:hypothetical protein